MGLKLEFFPLLSSASRVDTADHCMYKTSCTSLFSASFRAVTRTTRKQFEEQRC